MSDEQRRLLGRAAGDGDLMALHALQVILEREGREGAHPEQLGKLPFRRTQRGFAIGEFVDRYGAKCSVQDSSIATEACLWLGIDDPDPQILVPGQGWQKFDMPPQAVIKDRMHVNVRLAHQLSVVLRRFVRTGSCAPSKLR